MPGSEEIDQCPFCDALWGQCMHVRLLVEWESEALVREAEKELGANSKTEGDAHIAPPGETVHAQASGGFGR